MFKKDIENLFTQEVAKHIAEGWIIHTSGMSGHQGEIAKVVLRNSEGTVRVIYLDDSPLDWDREDDLRYYSGIELIIKEYKDCINYNSFSSSTVWLSKGEVVYSKKWYVLDARDRDYFVAEDDENLLDMVAVHSKRTNNKHSNKTRKEWDSEAVRKIALKWVKKQPGCKTKKLSDIKFVRKEKNYYTVALTSNKTLYLGSH